ncbi:hypothetical protein SAY87_023367 [Trapa incisa]|uniref:Uncharacterized protein n=1 Tax=Trapa incisa TaxID=236973 RepID=A0AAN7K978_9MYRT|nr:hypothetical protein SAY87_023367 [Trapa incisa]
MHPWKSIVGLEMHAVETVVQHVVVTDISYLLCQVPMKYSRHHVPFLAPSDPTKLMDALSKKGVYFWLVEVMALLIECEANQALYQRLRGKDFPDLKELQSFVSVYSAHFMLY